jgi:hypothetical protein
LLPFLVRRGYGRVATTQRLRGRPATPEQVQAIVDALDEPAKKIERI